NRSPWTSSNRPLPAARWLMLSLYYPADSIVHRAPTWLKLALLACGSVALFFLPDSYLSVLVILAPLLGYIIDGLTWRIIGTDLSSMSLLFVFMLISHLIFNDTLLATTDIARS